MKTIHTNEDGTVNVIGDDDAIQIQDGELLIDEYIDSIAKEYGYESIVHACSYAGYSNVYQTECIMLGRFRSECWIKGYALLGEVQSGARTIPTKSELIALMPVPSPKRSFMEKLTSWFNIQ